MQEKLQRVGERCIRDSGHLCAPVWQTLAFIQKLLLEDKVVTQREVYYCLVQHFSSQTDFNNTLQGTSQTYDPKFYRCLFTSMNTNV